MVPEGPKFKEAIDAELGNLSGPFPSLFAKFLSPSGLFFLAFTAALLLAVLYLPNRLFDPSVQKITYTLGGLAIWRYSWWMTHAVRSDIYRRVKYPKMRRAADRVWASGWRPPTVHFMLTTYFEKPEITREVFDSIIQEIRRSGITAKIWVGTGSSYDERVISDYVRDVANDLDCDLTFVRQNQTGKRMAIGVVLRAIRRSGTSLRDLVVFMDGDAVLGEGVIQKSVSLFGADPELHALTTDEEVVCFGPNWMLRWLRLRFAQRRIAMQSHALSGKVLTLTGRMSVFRARHVLDARFIRTVEADYLDHWLWGRFRFLSGDDKSTWYYLLTQGVKMTYVPDGIVYTIEVIEGSSSKRMVANLRRWSGNMLRNGTRAIMLGPRAVGPFIWWCLIDQRLAIWTMLVSPILAFYGSMIESSYLITAVLWILCTRTLLSLFLFRYARTVDVTWPFLLYISQVVNAVVKVYMTFRLSKQNWANRGNQMAAQSTGAVAVLKYTVANLQLVTAVSALLWGLAWWSGLV